MSKPDGGPAFPCDEQGTCHVGMTLRDYFAAAALQGMCASGKSEGDDFNPAWEKYKGGIPDEYKAVSQKCYLLADAMIAERDK